MNAKTILAKITMTTSILLGSHAFADPILPNITSNTCTDVDTLPGDCTISIGDEINTSDGDHAQNELIKRILKRKGYKVVLPTANPKYTFFRTTTPTEEFGTNRYSIVTLSFTVTAPSSDDNLICEVDVTSPTHGNEFLDKLFGADIRLLMKSIPRCE